MFEYFLESPRSVMACEILKCEIQCYGWIILQHVMKYLFLVGSEFHSEFVVATFIACYTMIRMACDRLRIDLLAYHYNAFHNFLPFRL